MRPTAASAPLSDGERRVVEIEFLWTERKRHRFQAAGQALAAPATFDEKQASRRQTGGR